MLQTISVSTSGLSQTTLRLARSFLMLIAALAWLSACVSPPPVSEVSDDLPNRIVGYVVGWKPIVVENPELLTHINYAFGHIDDDQEIYFTNDDFADHLNQLGALRDVNPDLKLLVSIGGWGSDGFSDAALTDVSRARLARSAVALIQEHNLDGIDLDWEYPGQAGPGITYRAEDRENFTLLLGAVRSHLEALSDAEGRTGDDRYLLTIASTDGVYFEHTEMDILHEHLDFINIMTYDFFGPWSEITGHHTGLYPSDHENAPARSTARSVRQHLEAGIPPEKLVIGTAYYGRGWTGVEPERNGLHQPYARSTGSYSFSDLAERYINRRSFVRYWDEAAKAPYLWSADSTTFITYDDEESLRHKAEFVRTHRLGGMMYWEHAHDADDVLLQAAAGALRR